jgi:plastocyanin
MASVLLLPSSRGGSQAAEPADTEEMRREIRLLKSQVQTLKSAISEIAELDRQRAAILNKALSSMPTAADAAPTARADKRPAESPRAADTTKPAAPSLPATTDVPPTPAPRATTAFRAPPRPRPQPVEIPHGALRGKVEVPAGEPVAYVYVENIAEPAVKGRRYVIQQVGKKFVPQWAVVQRGSVIEFPNLDNIYHNVFSLSSGNSFDLGLYNSSGDAKYHSFSEPGVVDIYCNIHPQMAASALVVPNRHFAKVKQDGTFEITGVPRGKRKVVAWAPGSRLTSQWVDLEGDSADVSLKLESKGQGGHTNKYGRLYGSYE